MTGWDKDHNYRYWNNDIRVYDWQNFGTCSFTCRHGDFYGKLCVNCAKFLQEDFTLANYEKHFGKTFGTMMKEESSG